MTTATDREAATAEARSWVKEHYPWMDRADDILFRAKRWRQYGPAIKRLLAEIEVVYEWTMDHNVPELAALIEEGYPVETPSGKADALAEFRANVRRTPREIIDLAAARWEYRRKHGHWPR